LKIVGAVKASSPHDLESEKQLVAISTALVNAMKLTLKASEVASIRTFRNTAALAHSIVKFKKALYKPPKLHRKPPPEVTKAFDKVYGKRSE
jgi:hypothetical protein